MKFNLKLSARLPQALSGEGSSLVSLALIWALSLTPFAASIDAIFYDFFSSHVPSTSTVEAKTLLIEVDYDKRNLYSAELESIAHKVLDNGAKQVVFLFSPQFSPAFTMWTIASQKVILGLRATSDITSPNKFRIIDNEQATIPAIPLGLVLVDQKNNGVYNTQVTSAIANEKSLPTIEFLAAQKMGRALEPNQTFWINFAGGLASLPRLALEDALKGNIVPEIVAGRSILIGLKGGNEQIGLNFPGGAKLDVATSNEYHAFALNTLLNKQDIYHPSIWIRLAILSIFTLLFFTAYQPTPLKYMLRLSAIIASVYGLLSWVSLAYLHTWLPLAEIMLLHVATLSLVYRSKGQIESQKLERMLVETSAKLNDKLLLASFTDSEEHWAYAITMVEQMLSLNRIIFLERIPGDHRVREIKALHCDINDIDELRRDYERTPYSASLKQNSPLETKNYLKAISGIDERQFMLPLVFGGEVLGFWAFGILSSKLVGDSVILSRAEALSEQISLLLYQRKVHLEHVQGENNWGRYLADRQSATLSNLRSAINLQEKRLQSLENLFTGLSTAAILYDFFGRVVLVNTQMNTLLQSINLNPYTMTAVDLITALTVRDRDSVRNYIQLSVFEKQHMSLHTEIGKDNPRQYQLSLRAIGEHAASEQSALSERLYSDGLLVELVDISVLNHIQTIKLQLVERLKYLYNNNIASLSMASELLKNPKLTIAQKDTVLTTIDAEIKSTSDALNKTVEFLSEDHFSQTSERYPVNALQSLQKAIEDIRNVADKRRVHIETSLPRLVNFVMASQQEIGNTFSAILEHLLEDTVEDGKIIISMIEQDHLVKVHFENNGMGIPQARMDDFLFGHDVVVSKSIKQLREALHHIKNWEGKLQVISQVGDGTHFNLNLEAVF